MSDGIRVRVWSGIGAAALLGGALIPSGPPGVGALITGLAVTAAIAHARPRPLDAESAGFTVAALTLLGMTAVLDAEWLILVDVLAAAGCAALAVTGAKTWAGIFRAPFEVAADALRVPATAARSLPRATDVPWAGPAGRAAAVSMLLLVTFGALFASADAAFARLAGDLLVPDVDPGLLPARALVALAIAAGAGGVVLAGRRGPAVAGPPAPDPFAPPPRRFTTLEWALPLALLDALFAAFVIVQITVLFGGHEHVLETTGLTYAQYARSGFFQLVTIAVLVLGVIALATKVAGATDRKRLLKGLLGALCVLTLVVLASALRRLDLYEEVYGLTRIRVAVYAVDLWLAGLFALVLSGGAVKAAPWLPRAVVAFSIVALLGFNVANPEGRIARSGVERWRETGEVDAYYLSTLGADAVPALMELPSGVRGCIVDPIELRLYAGGPEPWSSFNLARDNARDLLASEDSSCTSP